MEPDVPISGIRLSAGWTLIRTRYADGGLLRRLD
jgi:hypothetical protein